MSHRLALIDALRDRARLLLQERRGERMTPTWRTQAEINLDLLLVRSDIEQELGLYWRELPWP